MRAASASCASFSRRKALRRMVLASLASLWALACCFTKAVRFSQAANTPLAVRWASFWRGVESEMIVSLASKGGGFGPPPRSFSYLSGREISGLGAACIRLNVEVDLLTFIQGAHAGCFDG